MFLMFLCISILPTYNDIVSFLSLTFSHLVPVTAHPRILWKELIFILEYFMNINSVTLLISSSSVTSCVMLWILLQWQLQVITWLCHLVRVFCTLWTMAHYLNGGSLTRETSLQAISGQVAHYGHNVLYVAHLKNKVNTESSHMNLPSSSLIPLVAFLSHFSASSLRSLTLWLMSFRPPDTPPRDSIDRKSVV